MDPSHDDAAADVSLRDMATQWSLLRLAHDDATAGSQSARQAMVVRYSAAVRLYVALLLRDSHVADEVAQEVMVRMLRGDFAVADPQRGRFRDLLRHSVRNMVRNYTAKENRRRGSELDEELTPGEESTADDPWLEAWTKSLVEMAWRGLEAYQAETPGSVAATVLRLSQEHPDEDSTALAARLSQQSGKQFNAAAARQQLRRARLRFAQLIVEEVARGLRDPSTQAVEDELIALELMPLIKDFLPNDWREAGQLRADG